MASLDIIRGVALCGILLVNMPSQLGIERWTEESSTPVNVVSALLDVFVQQRFFPIFSLLFGIGFGLMWRSASRAPRPRLVMLRRLLFLAVLGTLHQFLHHGEVLLPYALAGLLLTLPLTWASRRVALGVGLALLAVATILAEPFTLIAALITLGFALAQYGIPQRADVDPRIGIIALAVGVSFGITFTAISMSGSESMLVAFILQPAGWLTGLAYIGALLLLARTPARGFLSAVFAPLGRMALTMYLMATAYFLLLTPLVGTLGFDTSTGGYLRMMLACALLLSVQIPLARWWLAHHDQGPMETLWRRVTWWGSRPATATARRETTSAALPTIDEHTVRA